MGGRAEPQRPHSAVTIPCQVPTPPGPSPAQAKAHAHPHRTRTAPRRPAREGPAGLVAPPVPEPGCCSSRTPGIKMGFARSLGS